MQTANVRRERGENIVWEVGGAGYGGEGRGVEVCVNGGEKKCEFAQKKGMKHID